MFFSFNMYIQNRIADDESEPGTRTSSFFFDHMSSRVDFSEFPYPLDDSEYPEVKI